MDPVEVDKVSRGCSHWAWDCKIVEWGDKWCCLEARGFEAAGDSAQYRGNGGGTWINGCTECSRDQSDWGRMHLRGGGYENQSRKYDYPA